MVFVKPENFIALLVATPKVITPFPCYIMITILASMDNKKMATIDYEI